MNTRKLIIRLIKSSALASALILAGCSILKIEPDTSTTSRPQTPTQPQPQSQPQPKVQSPALFITPQKNAISSRIKELLKNEKSPLHPDNVGYYMDVQYANLQQKLKDSVRLTRLNDEISITFVAEGAPEDNNAINKQALAVIAAIANEYNKTLIIVKANSAKQALDAGLQLHQYHVAIKRLIVLNRKKTANNAAAINNQPSNNSLEILIKPIKIDTKTNH